MVVNPKEKYATVWVMIDEDIVELAQDLRRHCPGVPDQQYALVRARPDLLIGTRILSRRRWAYTRHSFPVMFLLSGLLQNCVLPGR